VPSVTAGLAVAAAVLTATPGVGLSSPGPASAAHACGGYGISGGRVKSMSVYGTTCGTGKRIVRKLYRGENDGYRGNIVFVEKWHCRSNTGLTSCSSGRDRIYAHYVLY
jgi:hypothetical protein